MGSCSGSWSRSSFSFRSKSTRFTSQGLSLVDGDEATHKLSSHVEALADAKIAALTSYCDQEGITIPDFSAHFFKKENTDAGQGDLDDEVAQEDHSDAAAESDQDDDDEEVDDQGAEGAEPQRKKPRGPKASARRR
jgi:hypothetical protein